MENTFLAGRITYADISQQLLLLSRLEKEPDIIIYEHHERPDNLHIHFLVANPSKSREDTYTKWVKEICGTDDPNGDRRYSYKRKYKSGKQSFPVNLDFISYMSKGHLHPVRVNSVHNIFTPAIIEPLRQAGFDAKASIRSQNLSDVLAKDSTKLTEYKLVQEVCAALNPPDNKEDCVWSAKEVKSTAYAIRRKNNKPLACKQMAEFVQKCQFYLNPGDYNEGVDFWLNYLSGKKY